MKISIIIETHPEIIKMPPTIRECERLGLDYFMYGIYGVSMGLMLNYFEVEEMRILQYHFPGGLN
jgi:UDP-N-acetylglucosamine 2-epimerase